MVGKKIRILYGSNEVAAIKQSNWLCWRALLNHIHHGKSQRIRLQGVSRDHKEGTRVCKGYKRVHGSTKVLGGCKGVQEGHGRIPGLQGTKM